jgi:glycosyltransferase involved in cell wall biosynthesis
MSARIPDRGTQPPEIHPVQPPAVGRPRLSTAIAGSSREKPLASRRGSAPAIQLSVVVPAFREGSNIYANLRRLLSELDQLNTNYEVVVVSDGNTDATANEARRVDSPRITVLHYPMNIGKGFALSYGLSTTSGSLVTFIDADMDLDPRNIRTFLDLMKESDCDAVIGSKRHPQSRVSYPMFRRIQSGIYQLLVRLLFNLNVRDTQTGLKLFRRDALVDIVPLLAVKGFAFDLELLVVARKRGYTKILEAPIDLSYHFNSTVNLRAAGRILWDTAAIFYRLRILRYYDRRASERAESKTPDP